jgi:hypothetical protein
MNSQQIAKNLQIANQAQRNALVNSIRTPALQAATDSYLKSFRATSLETAGATDSYLKSFRAVQPHKSVLENINQNLHQVSRVANGTRLAQQLTSQTSVINATARLAQQIRGQHLELFRVFENRGLQAAMANFSVTLPDGWASSAAAYRDRLADELIDDVADDPELAEERLGQLAENRQAIIKCLWRFGGALEGFAYLPESPIPHFLAYLFILAAVIGEVADEFLGECEDDED